MKGFVDTEKGSLKGLHCSSQAVPYPYCIHAPLLFWSVRCLLCLSSDTSEALLTLGSGVIVP